MNPARERLESARLLLILDPAVCRTDPEAVLSAALEGGVDCVQLRDKKSGRDGVFRAASRFAAACRRHDIPFLVNDSPELAAESGADGVHVGEADPTPEEIRARFGDRLLVGLSTHDGAEVERAAARGADYVGLGPMFPTATKRLSRIPRGAELVREAAGRATLPLFCIGGIRAANVRELLRAGARRIAVSATLCGAENPVTAARELKSLLEAFDL